MWRAIAGGALAIVLLVGCGDVDRYDLGDRPIPTTVPVTITTTTAAPVETVVAELSPALDPDAVTHEIVPGDALYDLAMRYDTTVEAIVEANGIADPAGVPLGTILLIPSGDDDAETAAGG